MKDPLRFDAARVRRLRAALKAGRLRTDARAVAEAYLAAAARGAAYSERSSGDAARGAWLRRVQ